MVARAATQMAEDARLIAIERQVEQQTAAAKDAAAQRELQMLDSRLVQFPPTVSLHMPGGGHARDGRRRWRQEAASLQQALY
jgi:hypothetical protein